MSCLMTVRRAGDVITELRITGPASWWAWPDGTPRRDPIWADDPDGEPMWDVDNREWIPASKIVGYTPLCIKIGDGENAEIAEVLHCIDIEEE